MKRFYLVTLAVAFSVLLAGCPCFLCFGFDKCQIKGEWTKTFNYVEGIISYTRKVDFSFEKDTFEYNESSESSFIVTLELSTNFKGTYTLDPRQDPKQIDLKIEEVDLGSSGQFGFNAEEGQTILGIYEVDCDVLKIQLGSSSQRPDAFTDSAVELARPE